MINKLKSLSFFIFLVLWMIISFALSLVLALTFNRKIISYSLYLVAKGADIFQKKVIGIKVKIIGLEHIPNGPFILVAKHQSVWETGFFLSMFPSAIYILKREITFLPIFGWHIMLCGMIYINRKAGVSSIKQIIKGVKDAASENRPVIIFPEGTRVLPGQRVPLKPGIIAIHQVLPEIPIIAASHDSAKVWPKGTFRLYPGMVNVKFSVIPKSSKDELLKNIEKAIN